MSSALNSVMDNIDIGSLMAAAAGVAFPPAGIAMGVSNLLTQAVGDAVNSAVSQLTKGSGMPSFLQDPIREMIDNVMKELKQENDPECEHAAEKSFGQQVRDILEQVTQEIVGQTPKKVEDEEGESSSWLVALAKAMGGMAGKHAAKLVKLSEDMNAALDKQGAATGQAKQDAANEFSKIQAEFQAESQMFSMLQNSFSNALKSIGEGLTTMARKG